MKRITVNITLIFASLLLMVTGIQAQTLILSPAENSVTELHHIAVTVMGKPSAETKLFLNDELVDKGKIRIDGIFDFLNISVPYGPVALRVESIGAGNRVYVAERTIHVLGPPRKILPYDDEIQIQADGKTRKLVRFEIQDEWGYRLTNLKVATVEITHGQIAETDLDSLSSGIQVPIRDGMLEISIQSPKEVARATLEVTAVGEFFQFPVRFSTPQEPFILVGSVSGGLSNYQPYTDNSNEPDAEVWRQNTTELGGESVMYGGQAAFYAKGNVFEKYRLTASYDSRRNYRDQFFRDIDPAEQYPIYGDASILEYDAQTQSKLFMKLERNESSLIYGDYNTGLTQTEFTAYNRTFNGLIGQLNYNTHSLTGFVSLTDREMQLDEIRGEGISGYYYLTKSNVTEYSDKIKIQTRDKYHPEVLLKSADQIRYQDYTINYSDGSIMFKQPVPSIDADGNPVTIVISYEHKTGKKASSISGVRYNGNFKKNIKIGATAIVEERRPSNYLLYGVDATLPLFRWFSIKGEYAASSMPDFSSANLKGEAYKTEILFAPSQKFNIKGYYRIVDSSFVNLSQTSSATETGTQKYGFKGQYNHEKLGDFTSEFYRQFNKIGTINENSAEVFNLAYQRKFSAKGQLNIGYEDAKRERKTAQNSISHLQSRLIRGALSYQLTKKLSGTLERDQNLASTDQSKPTNTAVGLTYALSKKLSVFTKYKLIAGDNTGNQTVVGFDSKVTENTQLTGKYEIGGALGESRNRASIGLKNKWLVNKNLTLNFAYENASTIDQFETPTTEHQALSVAFEYLPESPWKTTGKWEYHTNRESRQYNYMLGTDFKVAHGLAVISKSVYSIVNYRASNNDYVIKSDNQFGLAYRPERSDFYNSLAKIAYLVDKNTHVLPKINYKRFIISTHHYWQPTARLEIGGRIAKRIVMDEEIGLFKDKVTTDFYAMRLEYDWSLKWYSAMDLKYIALKPLNESKVGASFEVGYLIMKNVQMGIGYAALKYDDPDFSDQNYMFENFYVTLHMKFSETIFDWK
ncbi:MAG: hypothetical protein M0R34_01845 [Candidatus Marinimicrobia bacterium]|nr:hypothetical protein [Candidatus Neomarinimicrobiota bacterium]MCK9559062.1 hypothetical protein [Candidatus Neomarinimicrobiota bacterium]